MPVDAELLESPAFPGLLARLKARAAAVSPAPRMERPAVD